MLLAKLGHDQGGMCGQPSKHTGTERRTEEAGPSLTECRDGQVAVKGLPSGNPIGPHACEHREHIVVEVGLPKLFPNRPQEAWQTCFWP